MIEVSSQIRAILGSDRISPIALIRIDFPTDAGGTLLLTDHIADITLEGDTYASNRQLESLSSPSTQNRVDRHIYTINFNDNDNAIFNRFRQAPAGVPLTVYATFINLEEEDVEILTDLLNVYKGFSSKIVREVTASDIKLRVEFVGNITKLEGVNPILSTEENRKSRYPNDTSMDYVYRSEDENTLQWGK